ncbi:hypothetical protein C8Q80DRAFT_593579 [Daedaleopsis nitida]|nr:hypothetical protein C8Q80DRAFT_593579 [Daedaleopsis nitida]
MQVTARVVLPEVINMLTLILRHVYPHHVFSWVLPGHMLSILLTLIGCSASVAYAIAKAPQLEFAPALRLHREAALLVCRRHEESGDPSAAKCDPSCDASRSQCGNGSSDLSVLDEDRTSKGGAEEYEDCYDAGEDDEDEYGAPPCVGHDLQLLCPGCTKMDGPAVACVDDEEGIVPLLTSALYHRWNLGLRGALIGFVCDRTSTVIRIVLGWLDEEIDEGNDLPRTHVTGFAGFDNCFYDLRDPTEAVSLLLFLRKSRLVTDIEAQTVPLAMLSWRADLHSRVEDSAHSIRLYDEEGIRRWSSVIYSDEGCRVTPAIAAAIQQDTKSHGSNVSTKLDIHQSKVNISTSEYVVRQVARPCCPQYFVARKVILYSKAAGAAFTTPLPLAYIHAASLVQFSDGLNKLQHNCPSDHLAPILSSLQEQYRQSRRQNKFIGYMTPEVEHVIQDSFCMIIHMVEEAQALVEAPPRPEDKSSTSSFKTVRVYNEATFRHQWDQLAEVVIQRCGSGDIHYEREAHLSYPENPLLDQPDTISGHRFLYDTVYPARYVSLQPEPEKAYLYWSEAFQHLWSKSTQEFATEPLGGIADGIISLTIPSAFASSDVAKLVSIWAPPKGQSEGKPSEAGQENTRMAALRFGSSLLGKEVQDRPSFSQQDRQDFAKTMGVKPVVSETEPEPDSSRPTMTSDAIDSLVIPMEHMQIHAQDTPPMVAEARPLAKHLPYDDLALHVPLFAAEYKKYAGDLLGNMAMDQGRLYHVAITTFLRLFNIARFPIFGLVTKGSSGVMTCSWVDNVDASFIDIEEGGLRKVEGKEQVEMTWVSDQDAVVVDLKNPLDALNVATFIAYIVCHHAPIMRKLFQDAASFDHDALTQYLARPGEPDGLPLQMALRVTEDDAAWKKQRVPVSKNASTEAAGTKGSNADPSRGDRASESIGAEATGTGVAQAESSNLTKGQRATQGKKNAGVVDEATRKLEQDRASEVVRGRTPTRDPASRSSSVSDHRPATRISRRSADAMTTRARST